MPMPFSSISIIIPAYNAQESIASTIDLIADFCAQQSLDHELIVVDDASTDATASIVRERAPNARLIRHPSNCGKGAAVRTGMLEASADWAMFLDADHSTHINHLRLVAPLAHTADVFVGSRHSARSTSSIARPVHRQLLGNLFPALTARVLPQISDTQCGFKVFKRWTVRPIFSALSVRRFAFDVEALLLAERLGASIVEFPVQWRNPQLSTLNIQRDAPQMLLDVLRSAYTLRASGPAAARLRELGTRLRSDAHRLPPVVLGPGVDRFAASSTSARSHSHST